MSNASEAAALQPILQLGTIVSRRGFGRALSEWRRQESSRYGGVNRIIGDLREAAAPVERPWSI
jgi:hypothetical protein